jgi:long-chain acyl-CoA synthetase
MNLKTTLEQSARRSPDKACVTCEGESITFAEMNRRANRFAHGLRHAHGLRALAAVEPGDRVGLLIKNSPAFIEALYGVLALGATVVPINVFLTPPEIAFIVNDCGVRTLVISSDFAPVVPALRGQAPGLRHVVVTDRPADAPDGTAQGAIARDELIAGRPDGDPGIEIADDADAIFLYTSGTTGMPKAAMLTHANFLGNIESCRRAVKLEADDSFLLALPMFHSFSLTVNVLLPIAGGCTIVLLESVRPLERLLRALVADGPTIFAGMPALYVALGRAELPPQALAGSKLRVCISGSAPLAEATLGAFEQRFPIPLLEGYGLSEAAPVVAINPLDGPRKVRSIGLPLPGVDVRIFDDDEVPTGQPGELVVRGPNVMRGYYSRPDETAAALRSGWLHTGDIARKDDDGYIFILDRKKDLIISKGMNIYPREIEEALHHHPKVSEAAVIAARDQTMNEVPVAFVLLADGESAEPAELISYLKPRLAAYKIPRRYQFVDEFPRTPTGKILKRELKVSV